MTDLRLGVIVRCFGVSALAATLSACGGNGSPAAATPAPLGVSALSGSYVFSVTGSSSVDGDYAVAGSFVADGKGNITSAVADYNLGSGIDDNVPLTGTYTANSGVATVTLTDSGMVKDSFTTTLGTSGSSAISGFDGTGSGTLYPQTTTGFSTPGTYNFSVTGEGQGVVSGSGQFVAGTGGAFASGSLTLNDASTSLSYSPVTGFLYPPQPSGRGQAALEGNNMSYYVVGPNQIVMIGLDERLLLQLPVQKQ